MIAPVRILIVEDHQIVAEGLGLILNSQADFDVIAYAATASEALAAFRRHRPDVTLMDLRLGGATTGTDVIRQIRAQYPHARIIVLSMYQGDEDVHGALQAGAATYVLKETVSEDLIGIIRDVHAGRPVASRFLDSVLSVASDLPRLTPRERQVIELVAEGLRNREIGVALGIQGETVEVHLRHIYEKLNVSDRTAAVKVATRRGIIHVE